MNPITEHTQAQDLSYLEHWFFAMGVAWRLLNSEFAFTLYAIFPFIHIERRLNFEATMDFLNEQNDWLENFKRTTGLISIQKLCKIRCSIRIKVTPIIKELSYQARKLFRGLTPFIHTSTKPEKSLENITNCDRQNTQHHIDTDQCSYL